MSDERLLRLALSAGRGGSEGEGVGVVVRRSTGGVSTGEEGERASDEVGQGRWRWDFGSWVVYMFLFWRHVLSGETGC
jgi:hypothetical protein